jgi:hypothetical protein
VGAIDDRLTELGIELPAPPAAPPGVELPFGMTVEVEAVVAIR